MTVTAWVLVGLFYTSSSRAVVQPPIFADELSCLEWQRDFHLAEKVVWNDIHSKLKCKQVKIITGAKQ